MVTLSFDKVLVNEGNAWRSPSNVEIPREGFYLIHFGCGVPAETKALYDLMDLIISQPITSIRRYSQNGTDTLGKTLILYFRSNFKLGIRAHKPSISGQQMHTTFIGLFLYRGNWV